MRKLAGMACLVLSASMMFLGSVAEAAVPALPEEAAYLEMTIASGRQEMLVHPDFRGYDDELSALYPGSGTPLHWLDEAGRPLPVADQLLAALADAESRGLRGRDYDLVWLREACALARSNGSRPGLERARLDFTLSLALLRYVSDLHIGRVDPKAVGIKIDVEPKKYDLAAEVAKALAAGDVQGLIQGAEPSLMLYRRLKLALAHYRELDARTARFRLDLHGSLKPGGEFPEVFALFDYLRALGDADDLTAPSVPTYSGDVVTAVQRFQSRHGLEADGIIGAHTAIELNTPLAYRVRQLELTLERLRWLPELPAGKMVVVNIPEFKLWAFDGPEKVAFNMAVVVGQAVDRQTPIFQDRLRSIIFAPYWNVPYGIARKEYAPKLAADPAYLANNDYELVGEGAEAGATAENIARLRRGELRLRQKPGPKNALGGIKFDFPNDDNVYLHSTPAKRLFARDKRAFSHGCVRVEDPVRLAEFLLNDPVKWNVPAIETAMTLTTPMAVRLPEPVPVLLFYATAVSYDDGRTAFYDDLYGHDARLDRAMSRD